MRLSFDTPAGCKCIAGTGTDLAKLVYSLSWLGYILSNVNPISIMQNIYTYSLSTIYVE